MYSSFLLKEKFTDCEIFYKFLNCSFRPIELSYFIFVRAVVEKETEVKMYSHKTGVCKDIRNFFLNIESVDAILERIFGFGKAVKINRFKQKILKKDRYFFKQDRIHVYVFLKIALEDYCRCRNLTKEEVEEMEKERREELELVSELTPRTSSVGY